MISLYDFWQKARAEIAENNCVMYCTIVEKQGSAPRGVGAHMLVLTDGTTVDTIGGGVLEYKTKLQAQEYLKEKKSGLLQFFLGNNDAAKDGMICGGKLTVLLLCFTTRDFLQIDTVLNLLQKNVAMLISFKWYKNDCSFNVDLFNDGQDNYNMQGKKYILSLDDEQSGCYREIVKAYPTVYLFGGGYVAQEVAKLLPALDFEYYLIEERAEFAQEQLFPHAKERIVCDYADFAEYVQIKPSDFVVIATSGHKSDTLLLDKLLKLKTAYLGAIGSRRKKAIVGKYLLEHGYTNEQINSIALPIGLAIDAETPAEIAISIVAQLIQQRAN